MALLNENFLLLPPSYLFADIAQRVSSYKARHPEAKVISLGIGDVTRPLCPAVVEAMHEAADEMAQAGSFHGYGPERGYDWLRKAIAENDYAARGLDIDADEIFVNDGAKSDTGNFQELFDRSNKVCLTDPVYPVYADSNVMAGRGGELLGEGWSGICYCPCTAENDFVPQLPKEHADLIYLCYPNNPTGTVLTREQLRRWVDYAIEQNALILYDSAYEAYITEPSIPHSIYEIEGARQCAVEFRSFSKTAGFTGVRCGYTVVPKTVTARSASTGKAASLHDLWLRRQSTKFNGASYISQRAALATYSEEGKKQVRQTIDYYMETARQMREALGSLGMKAFGGKNAPYIWLQTPPGKSSWDFFDQLLQQAAVVCTPGSGFGPSGEGYVRLTAFGNREDSMEAIRRVGKLKD